MWHHNLWAFVATEMIVKVPCLHAPCPDGALSQRALKGGLTVDRLLFTTKRL